MKQENYLTPLLLQYICRLYANSHRAQNFDVNTRGGRRRFFRAFALVSAKPKKSAKVRRKKNAKKVKVPEREIKKHEFALFPHPTVEIRFQITKPMAGGKQGS